MSSLTNLKLTAANAPHLHSGRSSAEWLWGPLLALFPILLLSLMSRGSDAFLIFLLTAASAVGFEVLFKPRFKIANSLFLSALLTLLMPQTADWRMALLGSFTAIVIARELFGGVGQNIFHPALAGMAVLFYFFPQTTAPLFLVSSPLGIIFLYAGGLFLIFKKWARWEIALFFLTGALAGSFPSGGNVFNSGLLLLGAFFIASDTTTSPVTKEGRIFFAFFGGFLTMLWSVTLNSVESLVYALLIMNATVPLLDSAFRLRRRPSTTTAQRVGLPINK